VTVLKLLGRHADRLFGPRDLSSCWNRDCQQIEEKRKLYILYCIIGDGEAQEGLIWEGVESAAHNNNGQVNTMIYIYFIRI